MPKKGTRKMGVSKRITPKRPASLLARMRQRQGIPAGAVSKVKGAPKWIFLYQWREVMREPYPVVVATRLGALAAHAKQLQLYSQQPISEANSLRDGLGELRYALSQLERHEALPVVDVSAQPMNVDPERLQHLRTEATKAEARIEACVIEHKKRHELYAIAAHVLNSAKAWIEKLPDAVALVEVPPVRVENGADHRKTLTVVRTQLAELQGKRTAVRNAPVPLYDLDQRAQAWIESQARRQKLVVATGAHELFNVCVLPNQPAT